MREETGISNFQLIDGFEEYVKYNFRFKNEVVECDSQKDLKIVDLTGAGDLFAAGFLHGHINNLTLKESLQKGTEMASKIIQKIGARLS